MPWWGQQVQSERQSRETDLSSEDPMGSFKELENTGDAGEGGALEGDPYSWHGSHVVNAENWTSKRSIAALDQPPGGTEWVVEPVALLRIFAGFNE